MASRWAVEVHEFCRLDFADAYVVASAAPGLGLSEQIGATDTLARAFDRLDGDKRALLVLHHLDRASVAEIAASLGIPTGTVKWRLHDAREALQRALVAEGEDWR